MTIYELSFAPTFFNESLNLPKQVSKQVSQKLKVLAADPHSAQGDAKKLKGYANVYRARVGDYRVFYSIGQGRVKLLSVRKRDERTTRTSSPMFSPLLLHLTTRRWSRGSRDQGSGIRDRAQASLNLAPSRSPIPTAYTLAIRRLQGIVGDRNGMAGVAVLMRYTLRLLTLQQFQRAAALICACEVIRREDPGRWGDKPFRIGLWVGQRSTPNWIKDADEAIRQFKKGATASGGTPYQLKHCPWCGTEIEPGRDLAAELPEQGRSRVLTYCGSLLGGCPFSYKQSPGEGLPVMVVDEELSHMRWRQARKLTPLDGGFPGMRYVLLHSFAHALMRQFVLECGYTAASLRERIYSRYPTDGAPGQGPMAGVLIYTAAPDSEGTLGGLVSLGEPEQLRRHLLAALRDAVQCASDPLCTEHAPSERGTTVHGAGLSRLPLRARDLL